ncbi:MAG: hypothetical protein NVV74_16300 [Magnetospirillum sp.]|nr:hypothetical protein [Magnetospirillum sp.]
MDVTQTVSLVGSAISATSGLLDVFKTASSLRGAQSEQVQAAKETVLQMKEALYVAKETIFAQKRSDCRVAR